jgi:high-affinity Fe2+/Pb2+ permease
VTDSEQAQRLLEEEEEGREGVKERLEREHGELVQELRALIPGAEVLFGFLLAIRFTEAFGRLDDTQRYVYYLTLLSTAAALVLYLAMSAHHRIRFRAGDKESLLRKGNRDTIAGTVAAALAFTGVIYLVTDLTFGTPQAVVAALAFFAFLAWRWWAVALYRVWEDRRE